MSDETDYPTNTANPHHNPDRKGEYPKTAGEWGSGDLDDSVDEDAVDEDKWVDSRGLPYEPTYGNRAPDPTRCNAVLNNYRERFGERRFCGQMPESNFNDVDHDYCQLHANRANLDIRAEETLQHGLSARTRDHVFRKFPDWQRLYAYGLYEVLLGESTYEFGIQHEPMEFDFTAAPFRPRIEGQDGPHYIIEVPFATENGDRDLALFAAAIDGVKMELANAEIVAQDDDTPAMSVSKVDQAQLTSPTDADPTQEFRTIETLAEHPLNLAYSRVVKDRVDLLQYGGIEVDGQTSDDTSVLEGIEALTVVEADTKAETPVAERAESAKHEGLDINLDG